MKSIGHAQLRPDDIMCRSLGDGQTEVWLRKNIIRQPIATENGESDGNSKNEDENLEYVYDEVYFQVGAEITEQEVEANFDSYWNSGAGWKIKTPLTYVQKITMLQEELAAARKDLQEAKKNSDMAIAELTMVMASMLEGGE